MGGRLRHVGWAGLLLLAVVGGCSNPRATSPKATEAPPAGQEAAVRERFAELQAALKSGDADKLWLLLADRSRTDAERVATSIQRAYAEAGPEAKTEQEKVLGLKGAELAGLTGKGVLRNRRFQKRYHEVVESKVEQVEVQGDSATLYFRDPEGETEKVIFLRQQGQWKAWLTIPRLGQPKP
jgi:hypothetical protein